MLLVPAFIVDALKLCQSRVSYNNLVSRRTKPNPSDTMMIQKKFLFGTLKRVTLASEVGGMAM